MENLKMRQLPMHTVRAGSISFVARAPPRTSHAPAHSEQLSTHTVSGVSWLLKETTVKICCGEFGKACELLIYMPYRALRCVACSRLAYSPTPHASQYNCPHILYHAFPRSLPLPHLPLSVSTTAGTDHRLLRPRRVPNRSASISTSVPWQSLPPSAASST